MSENSESQATRVGRFLRSIRDTKDYYEDRERLPERDDRADWDADDSGVLEGGLHYETDSQKLEYDFEDVDLDIHTSPKRGVSIIAHEKGDEWRSVHINVDADTADEVANQLELAAEMVRKEKSADIRT